MSSRSSTVRKLGAGKSSELDKSKVTKLKKSRGKLRPLSRDEIDTLIVSHTEHGERLARSFLNRWRVRMKPDEITSVVGMALCEAANRFDTSKGVAFKTFFFYHMRGMLIKEIIRLVEDQRVYQPFPQSDSGEASESQLIAASHWPLPVVEQRTPENLMQRSQLSTVCWEACLELDELEREVVIRYFIFDEALNTIARELKYCRCHISRVKSRALATLSKAIKDRLPDYRSSVFGHDALKKDSEGAHDAAALLRKKYKGGRGRRKVHLHVVPSSNSESERKKVVNS